jgi:hypothetical protein
MVESGMVKTPVEHVWSKRDGMDRCPLSFFSLTFGPRSDHREIP